MKSFQERVDEELHTLTQAVEDTPGAETSPDCDLAVARVIAAYKHATDSGAPESQVAGAICYAASRVSADAGVPPEEVLVGVGQALDMDVEVVDGGDRS